MTKIGIVGSGHVACSLAVGLLQAGYEVALSSRNPKNRASSNEHEVYKTVDILRYEEVVDYGEIILVAVEGLAIESIFEKIKEKQVEGKVIIDVTNPLVIVDKNIRFGRATGDSNGKLLQAMFPKAKVVKTLNIVNAHDMVNPNFEEGEPTMLICGDDSPSKKVVIMILERFGWKDIIDVGGIEFSSEIESYVSLWVRVAKETGSFHLAMKFLRK